MVLANKKETWNLNTIITIGLAASFLSLFMVTWRETSLAKLYFEFLISVVIFSLTAFEIKEKRDHLIHGVVIVLTTLPWVFYLLMAVVRLLIF